MKPHKIVLLIPLLTSSNLFADFLSEVKVSADLAFASNYIWRGMTQTKDDPAIQGALELDYKGIYVGTWASNINFDDVDASIEIDLLAGYRNELYGIKYDIGYGQYVYPSSSDEMNFGEAHTILSYDFNILALRTAYYIGVDTNDVKTSSTGEDENWTPKDAYEFSINVPMPWDLSADVLYGHYNQKGDYYSAGLTKSFKRFDFSLT